MKKVAKKVDKKAARMVSETMRLEFKELRRSLLRKVDWYADHYEAWAEAAKVLQENPKAQSEFKKALRVIRSELRSAINRSVGDTGAVALEIAMQRQFKLMTIGGKVGR